MSIKHQSFEQSLAAYGQRIDGLYGQQAELRLKFSQFLSEDPDAFERTNATAHFTGSAFVVDPHRKLTLLTHHVKLGRWLQLGGHCDGIRDPFFVAWKEAYEEGGLKLIRPAVNGIFDLSHHLIPEYRDVPAHHHYDVRYMFFADAAEGFVKSDESHALAWVPLGEVSRYCTYSSLLRLEEKALAHLATRDRTLEAVA